MEKVQATSSLVQRPPQTMMVIGGLLASGILHLSILTGVVVVWYIGKENIEERIEEKMAPFTPVDLVALGDPEVDDTLLPKIINPPKSYMVKPGSLLLYLAKQPLLDPPR